MLFMEAAAEPTQTQYFSLKQVPESEDVTLQITSFASSGQSETNLHDESRDVAIAVMGATGSGKSTFINLLSGSNLRVGNNLHSCTDTVALSDPFELDGRWVTLIDTPGFDDTNKSDTEILKLISAFLASTYEQGKKLAGVIYLHRISDIRMGGISTRNFKMFRQLCGDSTLKNVILVTTMWDAISQAVGEAREAELRDEAKFFKPVIDKGAAFLRHDGTVESGQAIMHYIVNNHPLALRIQRELVDEKKDISQTAAGAELNRELTAQMRKHEEEVRALQQEMREAIKAKDEETRQELQEERRKIQEEMARVQREARTLTSDYNEQKSRLDQEIQQATREAETARENHRREMQELENRLRESSSSSDAQRAHIQGQLDDLQRKYNEQGRPTCSIQ